MFSRIDLVRAGRLSVLAAVGLLCIGLAPRRALAQSKPNIVFILTDDQGTEAIEGSRYTNELRVHTPNLATLSAGGRVFPNARVNPFCSPTRACLMTGRLGLATGVTGVVARADPQKAQLSLQGDETTLAEAVRAAGYYAIHIDKWHLGFYRPYGQSPDQQGYDVFVDDRDYIGTDDSIAVGDELITTMVNKAVESVQQRADQQQPYFLAFWTRDPHQRNDPTGREPLKWWKVSTDLLPSGEAYYHQDPAQDTNRDRYRAVVESIDTEVGRMLRELGVIDALGAYRPESNTVVFFLSDNGSPEEVSVHGDRAKGTLYEPGVRVPCFVFGRNVPAGADPTLVNHVDLYETMCDVAGVKAGRRGGTPRSGLSFADRIGWATQDLPDREYTISSLGARKATQHHVALADRRWKLICAGGSDDLAIVTNDEFYDLASDPDEAHNLLREGMTRSETAVYMEMRDQVSSYWATAVGRPNKRQIDVPLLQALSVNSNNGRSDQMMSVGFVEPGRPQGFESRMFLKFATDQIDSLLPPNRTLADVERAQIVLFFDRDSQVARNSENGPMMAYPMLADWNSNSSWDQLKAAHDGTMGLGEVDLPPFIIPDANASLDGIPLPPNGPVSLGASVNLLDVVSQWHADPASDHGVVVLARAFPALGGDQSVTYRPRAILRLTLRDQ